MKKPKITHCRKKGVILFGHKPFKNKFRTCTLKSSNQNNLYIEYSALIVFFLLQALEKNDDRWGKTFPALNFPSTILYYFVLALEITPIRTFNPVYTMFWLDDFEIRNSYLTVLWRKTGAIRSASSAPMISPVMYNNDIIILTTVIYIMKFGLNSQILTKINTLT